MCFCLFTFFLLFLMSASDRSEIQPFHPGWPIRGELCLFICDYV